jgi:predicted nuclease with TOPRIM domain
MEGGAWAAVGVVVALIARELIPAGVNMLKAMSAERQKGKKAVATAERQTRKDTIDELRQFIEEQRAENESQRERNEESERRHEATQAKLADCEREKVRMRERVEWHEQIMRDNGLKFRPWTDEPTGMHRPLPPGTPPPKPEGE